eukprot:scaffold75628_cov19-Tisochrysis_lutea.AAC.1
MDYDVLIEAGQAFGVCRPSSLTLPMTGFAHLGSSLCQHTTCTCTHTHTHTDAHQGGQNLCNCMDVYCALQAMYFICVMLVVACGFYLWNVVAMVGYHASSRDIAVKVSKMDYVTELCLLGVALGSTSTCRRDYAVDRLSMISIQQLRFECFPASPHRCIERIEVCFLYDNISAQDKQVQSDQNKQRIKELSSMGKSVNALEVLNMMVLVAGTAAPDDSSSAKKDVITAGLMHAGLWCARRHWD